jgi:hypothetical protein
MKLKGMFVLQRHIRIAMFDPITKSVACIGVVPAELLYGSSDMNLPSICVGSILWA